MDKKIGPTFAMLRENKALTLKDATAGEFSIAQLSKFERGESNLSIDKFVKVLKNTQIDLDEFQDMYENYQFSEDYFFHNDLGAARRIGDLNKMKKWLNYWTEQVKKEPQKKFNRLNQAAVQISLQETADLSIESGSLEYIVTYLDKVSQWSRYELFIFSIVQNYLDDNMLKHYGHQVFEMANFYQNIHLNQQMVLRTMLKLVDTWLDRHNLPQALNYLNYVKNIGIKIDFFDEAITYRYQEARYRYLLGHKDSKLVMYDCVHDLEKYGYSIEAEILYKEIEKL